MEMARAERERKGGESGELELGGRKGRLNEREGRTFDVCCVGEL